MAGTYCWLHPALDKELITAGSTTTAVSRASSSIVKQAACPQRNVAIIRPLATTPERNIEPDRTDPTNKQQQRAHRHGEIPRPAELDAKKAWGESAREEDVGT